jgi:hypothetical protein
MSRCWCAPTARQGGASPSSFYTPAPLDVSFTLFHHRSTASPLSPHAPSTSPWSLLFSLRPVISLDRQVSLHGANTLPPETITTRPTQRFTPFSSYRYCSHSFNTSIFVPRVRLNPLVNPFHPRRQRQSPRSIPCLDFESLSTRASRLCSHCRVWLDQLLELDAIFPGGLLRPNAEYI